MKVLLSGCVTLCLLLATTAHSQDRCIPQKEIATHGVRLGYNEVQVRALLGKPRKITVGTAEDDGGNYPTKSLAYESLLVTLGRDSVEFIEITGKGHPIAAGLVIGESPDKLRSTALIDNSELERGATFGIRFCGADQLPVAGLSIYVVRRKVTRAVLYAYGP